MSDTALPSFIIQQVENYITGLSDRANTLLPAPDATTSVRIRCAERLINKSETLLKRNEYELAYTVLLAFLTITLKQIRLIKGESDDVIAYNKLKKRAISALDEAEQLKNTITKNKSRELLQQHRPNRSEPTKQPVSKLCIQPNIDSQPNRVMGSSSHIHSSSINSPSSSYKSKPPFISSSSSQLLNHFSTLESSTNDTHGSIHTTPLSTFDQLDSDIDALNRAISGQSYQPKTSTSLDFTNTFIRRPIDVNKQVSDHGKPISSASTTTTTPSSSSSSAPSVHESNNSLLRTLKLDKSIRSRRVQSIMDATYWDADDVGGYNDIYGNVPSFPVKSTLDATNNNTLTWNNTNSTVNTPKSPNSNLSSFTSQPRTSSLQPPLYAPVIQITKKPSCSPPPLPLKRHIPQQQQQQQQPPSPLLNPPSIRSTSISTNSKLSSSSSSYLPAMSSLPSTTILSPRSGYYYTKNLSSSSSPSVAPTQFDYRFHASDSSMSTVLDSGVAGLKNLGNSCYQNSILQCLFGTVPLVRYYMSGDYKSHINNNNPISSNGQVSIAFFQLISDMKRNAGASVAPVQFREMLSRVAPMFATREQQDSQEFLTYILDALHEDVKTINVTGKSNNVTDNDDLMSIPDISLASSIAWERYLMNNSSFICHWFMGQLRSCIQCTKCGAQSITYAPFSSLSIPIMGSQLIDGLIELLRPEQLEGDNAWRCYKCKILQPALQSMVITRLPPVLIIHLKRFSYVGPFRNKIDTLINYPIRGLDLSSLVSMGYLVINSVHNHNTTSSFSSFSSLSNIPRYDLFAVSNHYGGLDGGHYTSVVNHNGEWYYFDDSRVSKCHNDKLVTNAAYTLFYRQDLRQSNI